MSLNPKVSETLNRIVELFRTGNVPQAISIATFPPFDVPSNAWSLSNRIIMVIHGTSDARGFNQWKEVNRFVRRGAKAIHILAPWVSKSPRRDDSTAGDDDKPVHISHVLRGFLAVPVFRMEDTDGAPLSYENLELPELPLLDVARSVSIGRCHDPVAGLVHGSRYTRLHSK